MPATDQPITDDSDDHLDEGTHDGTDAVFKALADSHRRALLDRLRERGALTLIGLTDGLPMSRQAVSKHLAILVAAGLVTVVRRGREKWHYLNPVPIQEIHHRWISRYEADQLAALTNLKIALEQSDQEES